MKKGFRADAFPEGLDSSWSGPAAAGSVFNSVGSSAGSEDMTMADFFQENLGGNESEVGQAPKEQLVLTKRAEQGKEIQDPKKLRVDLPSKRNKYYADHARDIEVAGKKLRGCLFLLSLHHVWPSSRNAGCAASFLVASVMKQEPLQPLSQGTCNLWIPDPGGV